ncbi:MAG: FkbM family methyltransferase [Sphingobacteriia bacterium]|nr:FkbM family methyltransferase [Sphingobacteriia bacterium]
MHLTELLNITKIQFIDIGTKDGIFKPLENYKQFLDIALFEPNKKFFDSLEIKYQDYSNINVFNLAVSNFKGQANFYQTKMNSACSLLEPLSSELNKLNMKAFNVKEQKEVEVNFLDNLVYKENKINYKLPTILKIDAQGADLKILEGGKKFISESVFGIICEISFISRYKGEPKPYQIFEFMENNGFILIKFTNHKYLENLPNGLKEKLFFSDGIFIKENLFGEINETNKNLINIINELFLIQ